MTLSTLTSRVSYPGAASVGPFAFPFKILSSADLLVTKRISTGVETTLTLAVDYTVTGVLDAAGTVTLTTALAVGETLVIRRKPANTQPMSIRNQGTYFPATIEDEFDRMAMQILALQDQIDRSAKLKESLAGSAAASELEPTAGYAVTGTGSGFTMSPISAGAVALPGQSRTVTTLSAFLLNNTVFNLLDYAPVGVTINTGLSDATASYNLMRAAVVAAGGGIMHAPRGSYLVSVPGTTTPALDVPDNTWLRGETKALTIFKLAPNQVNACYVIGNPSATTRTRVQVSDLAVDGNRNNQIQGQFGIYFVGLTKSLVANVHVYNTKSHGIVLNNASNDNTIQECEVDTWGFSLGEGFGILLFNGCLRNTIVDCEVDNFGTGSYGIAVDASTSGGGGTACDRNRIVRCTVAHCYNCYLSEDSHRTVFVDCVAEGDTNFAFYITHGQDNRVPIGCKVIRAIVPTMNSTDGVAIFVIGIKTLIHSPDINSIGPSKGVKFALPPLALRPTYDNSLIGGTIDGATHDGVAVEEGENVLIQGVTIRNIVGAIGINVTPLAAINGIKIKDSFISDITGNPGIQVLGTAPGVTDLEIDTVSFKNIGKTLNQYCVSLSVSGGTLDRVRMRHLSARDTQGVPTTYGLAYVAGAIPTIEIDDLYGANLVGTRLVDYDTPTNIFRGIQRYQGSHSADKGDANATLNALVDPQVIRYASALTANRTITLTANTAFPGAKFRVVRTGLGAFTLDVGGLKTIPAATAAYVDVEFDSSGGGAWRLTGYGLL